MNGSPQPQHQRQPLRSIQLGGTGVRAVTPSPSFSQQLAFIRQFQQQPQQNQKTQQSPPIYRTQAAAQPQPQAQRLQPTYVQQQQQRTLPQLGSIPPFQSRGRSPSAQAQQPLLLRSPQRPTTPPSPDEYEDEYEDEEYEDEPEPVVRTQQVTQIRPIQLSLTPRPTPQQRQQVRITPQFQSSRATPVGPSRFSPSQPQPVIHYFQTLISLLLIHKLNFLVCFKTLATEFSPTGPTPTPAAAADPCPTTTYSTIWAR